MIANGKQTTAHTSSHTTEPRGVSGLRSLTNAETNTAKTSTKSSRPENPILFSITLPIDCDNKKAPRHAATRRLLDASETNLVEIKPPFGCPDTSETSHTPKMDHPSFDLRDLPFRLHISGNKLGSLSLRDQTTVHRFSPLLSFQGFACAVCEPPRCSPMPDLAAV